MILADRIKTLSFKSLRKSIIDFLIYENYSQKSTKIKLRLTKKSLGEKFGVQRTSLSRELNKMREDGLIDYDAYSITSIEYLVILTNKGMIMLYLQQFNAIML